MDNLERAALRRAADALTVASRAPSPRSRAPRPNLVRLFTNAAECRPMHGADRELLEQSAADAGRPFDSYRWPLRWEWLVHRDLSVAASGGGYLVEQDVPAVYDALRPWSTVVRAGVQILEGLKGNVVLPITSSIGPPTWHSSETAFPTGNASVIGSAVMTPKTVSNTIDVSRLLTLMAPGVAENYVRTELTRSIGAALDAAVLVGAGLADPLGIANHPTVNTATGADFAQATAAEMLSDIAEADALEERIAFVGHPLVRKLLQARARATGLGFIWDRDELVSRPAFVSTSLAADQLIIADWSRVALGLFGAGLEIEITPYASSGNFQAGIISARAILSCDTALLSPAAVCVSSSIT